jgi:hypothetical protein
LHFKKPQVVILNPEGKSKIISNRLEYCVLPILWAPSITSFGGRYAEHSYVTGALKAKIDDKVMERIRVITNWTFQKTESASLGNEKPDTESMAVRDNICLFFWLHTISSALFGACYCCPSATH